jgi:hypothetical protein
LLPAGPGLRLIHADAAQPGQAARPCQNVQLLIRPYSSQGAAGTIVVIYRIHNLSGQACTLYGYPGVQLLDRHFVSLPTIVHRGGFVVGTIPRQLVRLGGHGHAYMTLAYSDVPVGNKPCQAAAFYLMIWPPNDFLPVVTYAAPGGGIMACTGTIDVAPVTAQPRFH